MTLPIPELKDIEGIDPVSFWPLGIGWWILIGMCLVFITIGIIVAIRRRSFQKSWRKDALCSLALIEAKLGPDNARDSAIQLSEFLRRIVIKSYSRNECAGLIGDAWLNWLSAHDPKGFDWMGKGKALIDAPYAPQGISEGEVKEFIHAVKRWVR